MTMFRPFFSRRGLSIAFLSLGICTVSPAGNVKIEKAGQRLYAKAAENSDFATLPAGTVLATAGAPEGGWLRVRAPASIDCWIFSDTVSGDTVSVSRGKVRTAPNPVAPEVAVLTRGTHVAVRGKQDDWLKIAPPQNAVFWIRTDAASDTKESPAKDPVPAPVVTAPPKFDPPKVAPPKVDPPKVAPPKEAPVSIPAPVPPPPPKVDVAEVEPVPPPVVKGTPPTSVEVPLTPKWTPPPADDPVVQKLEASAKPQPQIQTPALAPAPTPTNPPAPAPTPAARQQPAPLPTHGTPAPASGSTISWPSRQPSTPASQVSRPAPVSQPAPTPVAPVSTEGWETPSAQTAPSASGSGAVAASRHAADPVWFPQRPYDAEWEGPSSGTLLRRKVRPTRHIVAPLPKGINEGRLRSDVYQGDAGHAIGVLVKDEGGFRMKPSAYELCNLLENGRTELVAYVVGTDAQLGPFLGSTVRIEGTCWWIGGAKAATLAPTSAPQRLH